LKIFKDLNCGLFTREVNELLVATKEDDYNYDIEAVEKRVLIENLS
jgi:hypothetical protein